jgi:hypothetical protein
MLVLFLLIDDVMYIYIDMLQGKAVQRFMCNGFVYCVSSKFDCYLC